MSGKTGIKVHCPASIGNFGAGLQILSAAIEAPGDEIIAKFDKAANGVYIDSITGRKQGLSLEADMNSASIAGQLLLDHLGEKRGIALKIHKKITPWSGLSSNAASAVGGVFAVNELLDRPLERYDLIDFALQASRKFDILAFPAQVASILFGGIILYRDEGKADFQKIYCPDGIQLSIVTPSLYYNESEKLQFLEKQQDLDSRIAEDGNIASCISAFYTSDFNLFGASLQEKNWNEGLLKAYPYFEPIAELSKNEGAFGVGFSGLGPSLYIASPNTLIAGEITRQMDNVFKPLKLDYTMNQTKIDLNGVYKF